MPAPSDSAPEVGPELIRQLSGAPFPAFAMLAAMDLDLFTPLAEGPLTAGELGARRGLHADRLELLLFALVAAGLLGYREDRFSAAPVAALYLARTSPHFIGELQEGLETMWSAALKTAETLRTGAPQARIDFAAMSRDEMESFYRGFYGEARSAGRDLAATRDLGGVRSLLDVGGGSGGLAIALAEAVPGLQATVADLPGVIPITQGFIAASACAERVGTLAVDVVKDPLPGRFDAAVLRAFLQVLAPEEARRALAHVAEALVPGGRLFVLGRILDDSRLTPVQTVYSNLVFLNIFPEGRAYTESEHRAWLEEAGFQDIRFEILSDGRGFVEARKGGVA